MARKLRILHTNMLRGWGGQSNRILTEIRGALAAGHEIALAAPDGSVLGQKSAELGVSVWPGYAMRPPAQLWTFLPDLFRFRRDLDNWKPDLIHLHGSPDSWLTMVIKRVWPKSVPVTIRCKHNIFPWHNSYANRWLYPRIDGFISVSSFVENQLRAFPGLAEKPMRIIHSVPDLPRLAQDYPSIRSEIPGYTMDKFLWGSTGRLRSEKAFDVLLKAFAIVRRERPNVFLAIAGDGSDRAALAAQAKSLGLGDDCLAFLGFRSDVPAFLKSIDAYVLASRSEGLGTAILEALAVGCPAVATNVGGIPDSLYDGETGLLAQSENPESIATAMIRLMDDPELARRFGDKGKEVINSNFTEESLYAKTLAFYEEMIGGGNGE